MAHYPGHVEDTGGTDQNAGVIPMVGILNVLKAPIFDATDPEASLDARGRRKVKANVSAFKNKKSSGHQVLFINNNMVDFEKDSIVGYELIEVGDKIFVAINLEVEEVGTHTWSFPNVASPGASTEIERIATLIVKLGTDPSKVLKKP